MHGGTRFLACTLGGLVCGVLCYGLASSSGADIATPIIAQIIASRTLIGAAIGLSRFSLGHWALHGIALGGLFSLPLAFSGLMAPENPEFSASAMFFSTIILGMIYGFLIEFIASVVLKLRIAKATAPATAA